jgi:hypothetical protein
MLGKTEEKKDEPAKPTETVAEQVVEEVEDEIA